MKKIFSIVLLSSVIAASAQISFAVKANALIPTSSATWQNFKTAASNTVSEKGKNITGFNAGLSMKIDLPTALYVMPEIYYSTFKNEFTVDNAVAGQPATTIEAKSSRVDVPVLLGVNVLGDLLSAYAGPVGSFNLAKDDDFGNFVQSVNAKEFTVGYQIGAQSEIKKLIISARYEGAFSKDQRKYVNAIAGSNQEITYDNRSSLFLLGLGYKF